MAEKNNALGHPIGKIEFEGASYHVKEVQFYEDGSQRMLLIGAKGEAVMTFEPTEKEGGIYYVD
ncbi:hypothetical protein [Sporosarcina sp. P17b]|uniref:hypothetical protein n=1 Tax=Sporosarcina sp. P17b TaxID=2048260 RepID=UPI000C16C36E|nr:hypothetical protein [Sporosarcina sp. P17b]PIC72510.1 hypothetical protein CSV76_14870 [Sporosarcina sp. P17b]